MCVSRTQRHILTFAVGMQIEGVSGWEVGGQRVYKESNGKDTQALVMLMWAAHDLKSEQEAAVQINKNAASKKN